MKNKIYFFIILFFAFQTINAESTLKEPIINSNSVYLVNTSTNTIIYAKNEHLQVFPASTTKLLTALVVMDKLKTSDVTTVSDNAIKQLPQYSSHVNLKPNETLSVKDLLYCLLLSSANDAALVLAEASYGSIEKFVTKMNTKAKSIGCLNSNFVNPHGFHDDNHYTTAYDMYLIMNEFIKNSELLNIVKQDKYTTNATNLNAPRSLINTNKLLATYDKMIGGKTGYTEEAGKTFVSYAKNNIDSYIITIYNDKYTKNTENKFIEAKRLLDYAFDNFKSKTILKQNTKFLSILDYTLLNKFYYYLKDNIIMSVPYNFDNITFIKYNNNLLEDKIQVVFKVSGLSTKLVKNVEYEPTISTEIVDKSNTILNRLAKNFKYNLNSLKDKIKK